MDILRVIDDLNKESTQQIVILNNISDRNAEDDNIMLLLLNQNMIHRRMEGFFEQWIDNYLEYDFFSLFRLNRVTFYNLLDKINCDELNKRYTGGEDPIDPEKQLMITLWWLGKGEVLLSASDRFNVSVSSVFNCTNNILSRLLTLLNTYISWPDRREIAVVENKFRIRSQYPGTIGAIDVCNIPFKAPLEMQESYIDRKLQHSIKLQAIVTADKIFTNIFVGFPGSAHDSRVLRNSDIFLQVEQNGNYRKYFYDDQLHIVGDSAYPLSNWLMTPYRDNGNLNVDQRRHNTCHSVTRIVVEHTFGILKSRWRILKFINVNSIEKAVKIIAACCILHNFCYVHTDFWEEYDNEEIDADNFNENARNVNVNAVNKRDNITQLL